MQSTAYAQLAHANVRPTAHIPERRPRTRVLIANHQPIVRHGLRALMTEAADIDVVGEAASGREAVQKVRQLRPDVLVIDLLLPDLDGISVTRTVRAESPDTEVVVMTGAQDDRAAIDSIRAGAAAYLPKDAAVETLLRSIRSAGAGQVAFPAHAAARLVRVVGQPDALSDRESEVLRLVAQGMANKQIARELGIAQSTVKSHVGSIFGKLGLLSRTQVALYAARTGMVTP